MLIRRSYSESELAGMLDEYEGSAVSSAESAAFGLGELGLDSESSKHSAASSARSRSISSFETSLASSLQTEIELRRALLTGIWSGLLRLD